MTTTSPNPAWTPGAELTTPLTGKMISLSAADLTPPEIYRIMVNTIVPRPIAFVSTVSADGKHNLAPFSFFNGVSSNPPTIMVSVAVRPDGVVKDTARNILETGEFVVNSANRWLIEPLVHTAGYFEYGVDEMKAAGLSGLPSELVKPLRVKESAVQFECTLYNHLKIGDGSPGSSTLFVGEIKKVHLDSAVYENGRIRHEQYATVGRLGGISYATVGNQFEIPIPDISRK